MHVDAVARDCARLAGGRASACLSALLLMPLLMLSGCAGKPKHDELAGFPADAVPKVEPKAALGNMESYKVFGRTYYTKPTSRGYNERGVASWYGPKFHGRKTSSGEIYDMHQMTAAHKTLPLPTYARVTNLENGRSAIVRINDRGPFVGDRVIDLSYAAAHKLDVVAKGTARVEVVSIDPRDHGGQVPKRWRNSVPKTTVAQTPAPPPATLAASGGAAAPIPALSPGGAGLHLQVGAFGDRRSAEEVRERLLQLLEDPVYVEEPAGDAAAVTPGLYRVRIGPVASRAVADNLAERLSSHGFARPMPVDF